MATPAQGTLAKLGTPAKLGVAAVLIVLTALVYWVIFFSDVSAKIKSAENNRDKLKRDLVDQQRVQATYLADHDELTLRQQRQRELNKALPPESEAAAFLSALQQVANVSGVDLKAWQPQEEQQQSFYAKYPMKLEITGRFHQIAKFTYELGRVERIINVENIELYDAKLESDEVKVKAKCLATTFHALKPKPQGSAGTPGTPTTPPPPPSGGPKK